MRANRLQRDLFTQLLSELEKVRVTPEQLLTHAHKKGMSDSVSGQSELAGADALVLLEAAVEATGDPGLPLRLGQRVGIDSYGTFGFALMSCANQRESIELLLRYGKVFFEPTWESQEHDGGLLLLMSITQGTPAQQQLVTELCFSQLSFIGRSLLRAPIQGAEVHFTFPKPSNASIYQSILDAKITFGALRNQLFLPASVLDTPVKTANKSDHVVFHQQCEEMLRGLNSVEPITAAVRQLLIQSAGDFLDIAQVAERLHVSERTLRRRLEAESTSFRATFEEVRDLLAREYLAETELTVAEIAHLLDYSETVNFRRAFARWNGATPSQYRQHQVV
ncbi:AraC family transcriptional regulator [Halieaceae bacterium IMCC14734]|uniref:AraC family transcriptional regulator n=1 Tax=Candidatus Litorirhabdus singularis TaxID=2518993 RepID=A0ABT3TNM7_9GAMM|nr:AraC family transcriptional regulator [Candidatus Litorirhabdus singularis]MCX2982922.1 AraC family transcriptional regulator [Candidatus Litorirhabdus singularis]